MNDVKSIVAKNITELRLMNGMTQLELGEKLNYSDKTISKWERGESSPEIGVLVEIARLFGVTMDYLVGMETVEQTAVEQKKMETRYNRRVINYIAEAGVWIAAIFAFVITSFVTTETSFHWLYFVYALPIAMIIRLVFNSIWFEGRHNMYIVMALVLCVVALVYFALFEYNLWQIFIIAIPAEIVVFLSFKIRKKRKNSNSTVSRDRKD